MRHGTIFLRRAGRSWRVLLLFAALSMLLSVKAYALTAGALYTITFEKLNSDGTVTSTANGDSLNLATTATADSDGKIAFSLNGIPNNGSCNFLIITITDSNGSEARKSIAPCPDAGKTLNMGASGVTDKQADAMIAAFASAGTDDPILAVFGLTIVRSTGVSSAELVTLANIAYQGIRGTNGFVDYMTANNVTTAQMATFRSSIISQLADPDSGYAKLMKDSVDVATSSDATVEAAKRGEAGAKLLGVMMSAATTAGFAQDRVLEAFNAMGAIAVPLINTAVSDGSLSAAASQMVNSSIGGGIQKLKADRGIEKYTAALSALGASGDDLTTYQTAGTALVNTMANAFAEFDKVFNGSETSTEVSSAESTLGSTMTTAFNTFMTATAASNTRLDTMITNIDNAVGSSTGLTRSQFQFYKSDGTQTNWPLMMVIPTDWISSIVSAGGSLSYTRGSASIPAGMVWLGSCSNSSYPTSTLCEANGATWTAARTDFVGQGMPGSYAAMFGIQEDIQILEFTRFASQSSAGSDMSAHAALEKAFANNVAALASNLTGTTDGSTAVSSSQKSALVELMKSPQF